MKQLLTFTLIAICIMVQGQPKDFSIEVQGSVSETTVSIENLYSDLVIVGTDQKSIRIETNDYEGVPEKAAGLKPLSATETDNTEIGLYVGQEGNMISILGASRVASKADYKIFLPRNIRLKIEYDSFQADDIVIEGMAGECEISSKVGDLELKGVTGPVIANTLSGDITVYFDNLSSTGPTSITSTSGDVDVSLPSDSKAKFSMASTSGEIYTDLQFEIDEEDGLKRWGGGMSAEATLNGGGVSMTLKSISGDVFIRSK